MDGPGTEMAGVRRLARGFNDRLRLDARVKRPVSRAPNNAASTLDGGDGTPLEACGRQAGC
jgi:hypothetical protein